MNDNAREILLKYKSGELLLHHSATSSRYLKHGGSYIEPYEGKYGRGYIWHDESKSTQCTHRIHYLLYKGEEKNVPTRQAD